MLTQQLQADELAVDVSTQLLSAAPHHDARLFYSTMVQDESRHVEAWLKLVLDEGGTAERDPHLDRLAHLALEADTLEEKVFLMQVLYERLIIPELELIAGSSRGTILEDLCNRLAVDEGIHHAAGAAYELFLLEHASKQTKAQLVKAANEAIPIFVEHALWRPGSRSWITDAMLDRSVEWLRVEFNEFRRLAGSLGLDVSDAQWTLPSSHAAVR